MKHLDPEKDKQEIKETLSHHIDQILADFELGTNDKKSLSLMVQRLEVLRDTVDCSEIWSPEQCDRFLDSYIKYYQENPEKDRLGSSRATFCLSEVFTTPMKKEKNSHTVSDSFAKSIIKQIDKNSEFPNELSRLLDLWAQNLQMVDNDILFDLAVKVLRKSSPDLERLKQSLLISFNPEKNYNVSFRQIVDQALSPPDDYKIMQILQIVKYFGAYASDPKSGTADLLRQIQEKTDNFWINAQIEQSRLLPLGDYDLGEQRSLIRVNWQGLLARDFWRELFPDRNISAVDDLSDEEVAIFFAEWRRQELWLFYQMDNDEKFSELRYPFLMEDYDVIPKGAENLPPAARYSRTSHSCYSKINSQYGVIYNEDGSINTFFALDKKTEKERKNKETSYGQISDHHLRHWQKKIQTALKNVSQTDQPREQDLETFLEYYFFRNRLPAPLKSELDKELSGLNLPAEIADIDMAKLSDFHALIAPHKQKIIKELSQPENYQLFEKVASGMEKLIAARREYHQAKYFGFAEDDPENLDFFLSFIDVHPRKILGGKHHSICYYLYLRQFLPKELVSEFEQEFKINLPNNLAEIKTYDDYLRLGESETTAPFAEYLADGQKFLDIAAALSAKISALSAKIKQTKPKSPTFTIEQILEREGVNAKDKEENERKALNYTSMIESPTRSIITEKFGLKLEDIDNLRAQVEFSNFIAGKSIDEVNQVKEYLDGASTVKNKANRVIAFLALEQDSDLGKQLIGLEQKIGQKPTDQIVGVYADFVRHLNQQAAQIGSVYQECVNIELNQEQLIKSLLGRANQIILAAAGQDSGKEPSEIISDFKQEEQSLAARLDDFLLASKKMEQIKSGSEKDLSAYQKRNYEIYRQNLDKSLIGLVYGGPLSSRQNPVKSELKSSPEISSIPELIENITVEIKRPGLDPNFAGFFAGKANKIFYQSLKQTATRFLKPEEIAALKTEKSTEIGEKIEVYFPVGISKDLPQWLKVFSGEKKAAKPIDMISELMYLNSQKVSSQPIKLVVCDQIQKNNYRQKYPELLGNEPEQKAAELCRRIGQEEKAVYQKIIDTFGLKNIQVVDYEDFIGKHEQDYKKYQKLCVSLHKTAVFSAAFNAMVQKSIKDESEPEMTLAEKQKFAPYAIEELCWIMAADGIKISHPNEARYDVLAALIKGVETTAREQNIGLDIFKINITQVLSSENINLAAAAARQALAAGESQPIKQSSLVKQKIAELKLMNIIWNVRARLSKLMKDSLSKQSSDLIKREYYENALNILNMIHPLDALIEEPVNQSQPEKPAKSGKKAQTPAKNEGNQISTGISRLLQKLEQTAGGKPANQLPPSAVPYDNYVWGFLSKIRYRALGDKGYEAQLEFKEPYSTEFITDGEELFSDQILIVDSYLIGGKLLTMPEKKQLKYASEALKPLIVNFFKNLPPAPKEYFAKIRRQPEQLAAELRQCKTIIEMIDFIRQYIIQPVARG